MIVKISSQLYLSTYCVCLHKYCFLQRIDINVRNIKQNLCVGNHCYLSNLMSIEFCSHFSLPQKSLCILLFHQVVTISQATELQFHKSVWPQDASVEPLYLSKKYNTFEIYALGNNAVIFLSAVTIIVSWQEKIYINAINEAHRLWKPSLNWVYKIVCNQNAKLPSHGHHLWQSNSNQFVKETTTYFFHRHQ